MSVSRKIIILISFIGVAALMTALLILPACDKRSTVGSPTESVNSITMRLNPDNLVVYSAEQTDTVYIDIWVEDSQGQSIDSVQVVVNRVPSVGVIITPDLTVNGKTKAK